MNPIQAHIVFKLFNQVDVRMWYYDTETDQICYVNSDGQTIESVLFKDHMAMKHPDDCPQVYESLSYMTEHHAPYPQPLLIRYKDESQPDGYRYTLNSIVPEWENEQLHIIGLEQDITSMVRKQQVAEEQTRIIENLLTNRNERTWRVDRASETVTFRFKNQDVETITIDKVIERFQLEECTNGIEAIEMMRKGATKIMEFTVCEKGIEATPGNRYYHCTAIPSRYDLRGRIVEYMGISSDVTDDIAENRKQAKALEEAQEQSRKKSVFVARASHDLRNPLNVLLSLSDMMCMDISAEERQELSEMMKQSGESLLNLINDILDLTRIESGSMQFTSEEFAVLPLVESIISSFDIQTGQSHKIMLDAHVSQSHVTSDSKRLSQILGNYLSNAIKYSPAGTDIVVHLRSDADGLYLSVTDQGCGISDADKVKVFDEFARFNTEVTGTGLGLSICKRIAEGLGGSVGFESQLGKGSTFWVKL